MTDEPDRTAKRTKAAPIAAARPVYDDTPTEPIVYPKLIKRPRVAPAPRGVTTTVTVSPPTDLKAAKGGLISKAKPKAAAKGKPKPR